MRLGIGLGVVIAFVALVIGSALWASKHPKKDEAQEQPDDGDVKTQT